MVSALSARGEAADVGENEAKASEANESSDDSSLCALNDDETGVTRVFGEPVVCVPSGEIATAGTTDMLCWPGEGDTLEAGEIEERASEADKPEAGEAADAVTAVTLCSKEVGENEKDEGVAGDAAAMTVAVTGAPGEDVCGGWSDRLAMSGVGERVC